MSQAQKIMVIVLLLVILGSSYFVYSVFRNEEPASGPPRIPFVDGQFMLDDLEPITAPIPIEEDESSVTVATSTDDISSVQNEITEPTSEKESPAVEVVVENLTIPWGLAFLPNDHYLIAERGGSVIDIDPMTGLSTILEIAGVLHSGEGGLLGLTLHPDFETNRYVYMYRTSTFEGRSINSVLRYVYRDDTLSEETIIIDNIPGALFHNGGRIAFGPDGFLYIATGDAQNPEFSQDINNLAGKILRVTDTGDIPAENPFDSPVYSYGHRNPQGLAWDSDGALWSTEHGRSGLQSGLDELNLVIPGGNYGWPKSQGDTVFTETVGPTIHSGDITWAPASAAYVDGSIFFGGLRGASLYEAVLNGVEVAELKVHFSGEFGRIRTVATGPDGMLYFTTSNRDGRGTVLEGDDKILRVDPSRL